MIIWNPLARCTEMDFKPNGADSLVSPADYAHPS